jgi:hypothetical protein
LILGTFYYPGFPEGRDFFMPVCEEIAKAGTTKPEASLLRK